MEEMFPCKQMPLSKQGKDNWDEIFRKSICCNSSDCACDVLDDGGSCGKDNKEFDKKVGNGRESS